MHHFPTNLSWSKKHLLVGVFEDEFISLHQKLYYCLENIDYSAQINLVKWSVTILFPVPDTKRHLTLRIVYKLNLSLQILKFFISIPKNERRHSLLQMVVPNNHNSFKIGRKNI